MNFSGTSYGVLCAVLPFLVACGDALGPLDPKQTAPDASDLASVEQAVDVGPSKRIGTWCADRAYETTTLVNPPGPWLKPPSCLQADSLAFNMTGVPRLFAYNLVANAKFNLESSGDHLSNELVDLMLFEGHAGYYLPAGVTFAVHEAFTRAVSTNMAFGHTGGSQRGLSVFAAYACNTVDFNGLTQDPYFANGSWAQDWIPAFSPGLRLFLGSNKLSYFTNAGYVGSKFGMELKAGKTFMQAWITAWDQVQSNDSAAFVASGISEADCFDRIQTMTWENVNAKPRRVNPPYLCAMTQAL